MCAPSSSLFCYSAQRKTVRILQILESIETDSSKLKLITGYFNYVAAAKLHGSSKRKLAATNLSHQSTPRTQTYKYIYAYHQPPVSRLKSVCVSTSGYLYTAVHRNSNPHGSPLLKNRCKSTAQHRGGEELS